MGDYTDEHGQGRVFTPEELGRMADKLKWQGRHFWGCITCKNRLGECQCAELGTDPEEGWIYKTKMR